MPEPLTTLYVCPVCGCGTVPSRDVETNGRFVCNHGDDHPLNGESGRVHMQPEPVFSAGDMQAVLERAEEAEAALVKLRDDEDSAGAECSRLESDILELHLTLERGGLEGVINADNVGERIELLLGTRRSHPRAECFICCKALGLHHLREFPDGCVVHEDCFIAAPYEEIKHHMVRQRLGDS